MGLGALRRHRAILDAAAGAVAPSLRTREQVLEEQLAAEKARADALQRELANRGRAAKMDVNLLDAPEVKAVLEEARKALDELDASRDELAAKLTATEQERDGLATKLTELQAERDELAARLTAPGTETPAAAATEVSPPPVAPPATEPKPDEKKAPATSSGTSSRRQR